MSKRGNSANNDNGSLAMRLILLAVGMFGFGFLLVPLYDAFCDITGLGGRTNETPFVAQENRDENREIDLEFVTTVNEYAPFVFESRAQAMTVHPGGIYEASFMARNLTGHHMIAQAVPSIAPFEAASFFKKLDCFCFTSQEFAANEERELKVRFIVDTELPDYVDTITLSYTFFDTARLSNNSQPAGYFAHSKQ